MATTSERLREILSIRDIKQVEITEKTGISKGALSSYLSGRYIPKQDNIYKLAKVLDVNPAWLMGLDVPMEPVPSGSGLSTAPASSPVAPVQLRSDESELLVKYNLLNGIGKKEANRHMNYLCSQEEYIKDTASEESNKVS